MPLANAFLTKEQLDGQEATYRLAVAFCQDCALLQITDLVPPERLFREYLYFSSYSDTMLRHAHQLVQRLIAERALGPRSFVVELASNDGYLLQYYKKAEIPILGVEPAENIARHAREARGIPTLAEFFDDVLAKRLVEESDKADVIHAHNVLAHVPSLNEFVRGIAFLLKDTGVGVIEVPYVKEMLDRCEFDTIYHEHLCYFSLTALTRLFSRHGLLIEHVERIPIHGGSLRLFVTLASPGRSASPAVEALLVEEGSWGVGTLAFYRDFAARIERLKSSVQSLLQDLKGRGARLAAYGAAAKGTTFLNYCGIGGETLDFVVDRSIHKQGRFMPGVRLPIYAPETLLTMRPDYVLLLSWNFADEILKQQQLYRDGGGKFIIPLPEPHVV